MLLGLVKSLKKEIDAGQEELGRQIDITDGIVKELGKYDLYVKIEWPDSQEYMGGDEDEDEDEYGEIHMCEDGSVLIPMSMVHEEDKEDKDED